MVKIAKADNKINSKEPPMQGNQKKRVIKGRWSQKEVELLKKLFETKSGLEIAKELNRSLPTIRQKIFKLKLKKRSYNGWSANELKKLLELFPVMTNELVAKKLKRSINSIREKAHRMKLKKDRSQLIEYEKTFVKDKILSLKNEFSI